MTGQKAFIIVSTGSDGLSAIHSRCWEVPADGGAMDQLAATLTEAYGAPVEWFSDDADSPDRPRIVFYDGIGSGL